MKTLSNLFSSSAKTEILCVLYHQTGMVGLRQLSRIAGIRVRSTELALDSLLNTNLVRRVHKANRVFYSLIRTDPRAAMLAAVFDAAALASIREVNRSVAGKTLSILPFIAQANRMLNHARTGTK